ncbi:phosphoribosylformylglycinamidine synthase subunit PurS [Candidatus Poribacteria bacterium]|nr:phosphoribosylformylglycinamidine synthase subunit PurS [Candidatus Poribacteria bacterium]
MKGISMQWKIEIGYKPTATDAMGQGIEKDIEDLGISGVEHVRTMHIYIIEGEIADYDIENICENLLTDRITQVYRHKGSLVDQKDSGSWVVEVTYKPGVTDPVGESTVKGAKDLGINGIKSARTGQKYVIKGKIQEEDIDSICKRLLANDVIQNYKYSKIA